MKSLGTILPTQESLRISETTYLSRNRKKLEIGRKNFPNLKEVFEQGEYRYYEGQNRYAIVGNDLKIRFFERKEDGYFYFESWGKVN